VVTQNGRATGIEVMRGGARETLHAERVILSSGALRSPQLLMLSGIGDGAALATLGIATLAHRPGVGANLHDHPIVSMSAYTVPARRMTPPKRSVVTYRRYTSGIAGCEPSDMVMSAGARSMWHAVGERIPSLRAYIAIPYSRGWVRLASPDPLALPAVDFNGLSDERDIARMVQGFRGIAEIMFRHLQPEIVSDVFPSKLSRRIEAMSRPTTWNAFAAKIGATLMDASPALRRFLIRNVITNGERLADILADDRRTADYVRSILGTSWHPSGTCRMGAPADPLAVTTPEGAVIGVPNLHVVDASIMPRVPRTNTNLPTIMIAEKLAPVIARKAL
jgi:5-(hydroxymethyl)furfural/furfural oxidase